MISITSFEIDFLIKSLAELRSAIRVVFDTSIAAMTDEEASLTVENWQYFGELS